MEQDLAKEEQQSLLSYYEGEKEPETKEGAVAEEVGEAKVVDGVAVGSADVVGAPVARVPWSSGLFGCLGTNDEFLSSDIEVCCLGAVAPCVLYASNVERLYPSERLFFNHCLLYNALYVLGQAIFNANCLAPCFSYPSRAALRKKYNIQGHGEYCATTFGCCSSMYNGEGNHECLDQACDFGIHLCCHTCSLCQEGRELRRRMPHPGFYSNAYVTMSAPREQSMSQ